MDNKRLLFFAGFLVAVAVCLILVFQSGVFSSMDEREQLSDDIRSGNRSLRGDPGRVSARDVERSSKAADRVLEVRLPSGDARARLGGPVVLALQGNNVLYRRKDPVKPHLTRNVLGRKGADSLLLRVLSLETPPQPVKNAWAVVSVTAAGKRELALPEETVLPLLRESHLRAETWFPTEITLQVAVRARDGASPDTPVIPWPFRRVDPQTLVDSPGKVAALKGVMKKFLGTWTPDTLLERETDTGKGTWRVTALSLL